MKIQIFFDSLYNQINSKKITFFVTFFGVVFLSYAVLFAIDFLPEPIQETSNTKTTEKIDIIKDVYASQNADLFEEEPIVTEFPLPIKIIFDTLDKEIKVLNPTSNTIPDLDNSLLSGAVRHPDSADFSEDGNIFILAHSSHLPNVLNKNFQAFNDIENLTWGDRIRLHSKDTEYIYRVEKVFEAKASDVFIPETPGEARLTLATCNSFGAKEDRFIVQAVLIGEKPLN